MEFATERQRTGRQRRGRPFMQQMNESIGQFLVPAITLEETGRTRSDERHGAPGHGSWGQISGNLLRSAQAAGELGIS